MYIVLVEATTSHRPPSEHWVSTECRGIWTSMFQLSIE